MRWRRGACCLVVVVGALTSSAAPVADIAPYPVVAPAAGPLVPGRPGGTFYLVTGEPMAIDPSNVVEQDGLQVTSYLFTGLVTVTPTGTVSPGVATYWVADPGCVRWTFHLAHGTRFHNGEEVTSQSFARAWERASTGESAWLLEPLRTVDATDPHTLRVTLDRGDCELLQRMIHPAFSPVPAVAGPADNGTYNDRPIGNGPFRMAGPWLHREHIRLVRNDDYRLGPTANLAAVDITVSINPTPESYRAFRAGRADWAQLPGTADHPPRSRHEPAGQLVAAPTAGVSFLVPAVTTEPLNTPLARKAISLAIDRATIAREAFADGPVPATSLVPPPLRSRSAPVQCDACRYDPAEARRLAGLAGLTPGTVLHFRYNDRAQHETWSAAVKRQLEATLGIKVNYYYLPFAALLENQRAPGVSGISRSAWRLDYPSRGNILVSLLSTATIGTRDPDAPATGDNAGRYSNQQVDRLLDQARLTAAEPARTALYERAERIAIGADLALIPLWYHRGLRLVANDRFVNLRMDWYGNADLAVISLRRHR